MMPRFVSAAPWSAQRMTCRFRLFSTSRGSPLVFHHGASPTSPLCELKPSPQPVRPRCEATQLAWCRRGSDDVITVVMSRGDESGQQVPLKGCGRLLRKLGGYNDDQ
ncbi:unnamed protein product [Boreogadus saida]